jgi:hypothetical protein
MPRDRSQTPSADLRLSDAVAGLGKLKRLPHPPNPRAAAIKCCGSGDGLPLEFMQKIRTRFYRRKCGGARVYVLDKNGWSTQWPLLPSQRGQFSTSRVRLMRRDVSRVAWVSPTGNY